MATVIPLHKPRSKPARLYQWLLIPLVIFLITRLLIFGIVFFADNIVPGFNDIYFFRNTSVENGFVQAWNRWDTVWYVDIVENGYRYVPGAPRNTVAFFPLYPMAMAALTPITKSPLVAGLLISNLSFLAALVVFYQLALLKTKNEDAARRSVFYIAVFPASMFYAAAYTESLFLLLSLLVAYFAARQRWWLAGTAGMLAAATRSTGLLLMIVVGWEWLEAHGFALKAMGKRTTWTNLWNAFRTRWYTFLPVLIIPAGLIAYMLYLGYAFGDPFASMNSQSGWRQPSSIQSFLNDIQLMLNGRLWPSFIMDMGVFFILMALIIPIGRKLSVGYALYVAAAILIPASTGVMSMTRFSIVMFPVFLLLGLWVRNKWLDAIFLAVSLVLLPLFALMFIKSIFLG